MHPTRDDILQTLASNAPKIRAFGVTKLGLFGSCARNESSNESDLDFVVDFDRPTFDAYMDLKDFLENLFSTSVDLVPIDAIKPRLKPAILEETIYAAGF